MQNRRHKRVKTEMLIINVKNIKKKHKTLAGTQPQKVAAHRAARSAKLLSLMDHGPPQFISEAIAKGKCEVVES